MVCELIHLHFGILKMIKSQTIDIICTTLSLNTRLWYAVNILLYFYLKFGYISNSFKRADENEISALFYPKTLHIDKTKFCNPSVPTHELKNNIICWIQKPTMKRIWIGGENCWIYTKKTMFVCYMHSTFLP